METKDTTKSDIIDLVGTYFKMKENADFLDGMYQICIKMGDPDILQKLVQLTEVKAKTDLCRLICKALFERHFELNFEDHAHLFVTGKN